MTEARALRAETEPGVVRGEWWHRLDDGRVQCDLCPRFCKLHDGQKAFCFVREARNGEIVLTSYGRATGYCVDPIEKKPLNHFYPGSSVLSFGTAGCNFGCRFCQNWDISKAREDRILAAKASPARVAEIAVEAGCKSVAFTYNDPVIFAEYAIDCAIEAHARGVKTVAVSSGYMAPEARRDFYANMDAANIDLKAFTEAFYHKLCFAHLEPVLDTLKWLKHETRVWLEVTTLLIPGHNDSEEEVEELCAWFAKELGSEVPLHFTAFHPDFKMMDVPPTPAATLVRAREQARAAGLKHVYTGNVRDARGQSSYCADCGQEVIGRDGYAITAWRLDGEARCPACSAGLAGHFESKPGPWGTRRRPLLLVGVGSPANEYRRDAGRTLAAKPGAHAIEHPIVGRFAAMTSEHDRLGVVVRRLANVCAELESGRTWVDPVPVIAELELGLWGHFATEEANDYFGAIARERPALLPKVTELKAEHIAILRAVSELSVIAADKRRRRDVTPSAAKVIAELRTHEDEENQLLQEFVLRDEGAGQD